MYHRVIITLILMTALSCINARKNEISRQKPDAVNSDGGGAGGFSPKKDTGISSSASKQTWSKDTTKGVNEFSSYNCAPETNENGPEIVFPLEIKTKSFVKAWVDEEIGVDVDIHILSSLEKDENRMATHCIARGNSFTYTELEPGSYFIVIDTFENADKAGKFTLTVKLSPELHEVFYDCTLAEGIRFKSHNITVDGKYLADVHNVIIDLNNPNIEVKPLISSGKPTSEIGKSNGAFIAINATYFDAQFNTKNTIQVSNNVAHEGTINNGFLGLYPIDLSQEKRMATIIDENDTAQLPKWQHVVGGTPMLFIEDKVNDFDGFSNDFAIGRHPRTVVATDASNKLILSVVDGRREDTRGIGLDEMRNYLKSEWKATGALNFDGGGSSTLWVDGAPEGGVLNKPSDGQERYVMSALGVFHKNPDISECGFE